MVVDPNAAAVILNVSDLNPIKIYPPDGIPYNSRRIKLITPNKYFQKFDFTESLYNRLDVLFNDAPLQDWDAAITYQIGDKVYDPHTQTRWVSVSANNLNNNPNPLNTDPGSPSGFWDHSPLIGAPIDYDFATAYNTGDRALAYFGLGTPQYVVQSLQDANTGNQPNGNIGVWWDYVTESRGITYPKLRILKDGSPIISDLPFSQVRANSNHAFVNWLWAIFPELENGAIISLDIYDAENDTVLAISDCLEILIDDVQPSLTIKYTNSDDFNGIAFEAANQEFYIRLNALFYEETHPVNAEDYILSNGFIVSLRKEMVSKRLLRIIEFMTEEMHKKVEQILMCDFIEIVGLPWKKQDDYQRTLVETSLLSTADVLLTRQDEVLINISKGDIYSGGRVFSGEFSGTFS